MGTQKSLNLGIHTQNIWYFAEAFVQSASATQGNKYTCGADDLSGEQSQIKGYSYSHVMFTAMPYQPKHLFFSICFPLEMVWHFVVVRQAVIHVVPPYGLMGRLSGSRPCRVIGKACWGLAAFVRLRDVLAASTGGFSGSAGPAAVLRHGIGAVGPLLPTANPQDLQPCT